MYWGWADDGYFSHIKRDSSRTALKCLDKTSLCHYSYKEKCEARDKEDGFSRVGPRGRKEEKKSEKRLYMVLGEDKGDWREVRRVKHVVGRYGGVACSGMDKSAD